MIVRRGCPGLGLGPGLGHPIILRGSDPRADLCAHRCVLKLANVLSAQPADSTVSLVEGLVTFGSEDADETHHFAGVAAQVVGERKVARSVGADASIDRRFSTELQPRFVHHP